MTYSNLHENPLPYPIWGEEFIDEESKRQMDAAMRLPITVAGALMPDAHVGYGLPIGGVLATENAVIPYAVGVDIACRMMLSVFPISPIVLGQQAGRFENALLDNTLFGAGKEWQGSNQAQHEVMDDAAWRETGFLNNLKDKAQRQLGTSGSGNHFVEWGAFKLNADDSALELERGSYLALLSHSGSRGVGYQIADRFSKLAMEQHPELDKSVRQLAWLDLDSSLGYEYWLSMELAGRFASANHHVIHDRIAKAVGLKPTLQVENHHNFAWKIQLPSESQGVENAREVIVHRKGATPAAKGELGVIPGSMGDPGYIVRGKGNKEAIYSASHGAGRQLSRTAAKTSITSTERNKYLRERDVKLFGGDLDEAPQAYKNLDQVIQAQANLVEVIASFTPKIVRMDGKINDGGKKSKGKDKPSRKSR